MGVPAFGLHVAVIRTRRWRTPSAHRLPREYSNVTPWDLSEPAANMRTRRPPHAARSALLARRKREGQSVPRVSVRAATYGSQGSTGWEACRASRCAAGFQGRPGRRTCSERRSVVDFRAPTRRDRTRNDRARDGGERERERGREGGREMGERATEGGGKPKAGEEIREGEKEREKQQGRRRKEQEPIPDLRETAAQRDRAFFLG